MGRIPVAVTSASFSSDKFEHFRQPMGNPGFYHWLRESWASAGEALKTLLESCIRFQYKMKISSFKFAFWSIIFFKKIQNLRIWLISVLHFKPSDHGNQTGSRAGLLLSIDALADAFWADIVLPPRGSSSCAPLVVAKILLTSENKWEEHWQWHR